MSLLKRIITPLFRNIGMTDGAEIASLDLPSISYAWMQRKRFGRRF